MGIVFPKKFPLWCHWMIQSPESPEEAKGQDGMGERRGEEGEEGQGRGSQCQPWLSHCLASVFASVKGDVEMLGFGKWFPVQAAPQNPRLPGLHPALPSEAGRGAWESRFSGTPRVSLLHT